MAETELHELNPENFPPGSTFVNQEGVYFEVDEWTTDPDGGNRVHGWKFANRERWLAEWNPSLRVRAEDESHPFNGNTSKAGPRELAIRPKAEAPTSSKGMASVFDFDTGSEAETPPVINDDQDDESEAADQIDEPEDDEQDKDEIEEDVVVGDIEIPAQEGSIQYQIAQILLENNYSMSLEALAEEALNRAVWEDRDNIIPKIRSTLKNLAKKGFPVESTTERAFLAKSADVTPEQMGSEKPKAPPARTPIERMLDLPPPEAGGEPKPEPPPEPKLEPVEVKEYAPEVASVVGTASPDVLRALGDLFHVLSHIK